MAQQWFYARGDQKAGPITSKQLREMVADGGLRPNDLVWTEGMEQWKEARMVKGLFATAGVGIGEGPPPLPSRSVGTAPRPTEPAMSDDEQQPVTSPQGGIRPLWIGLAIALFFPLGFHLLKKHPVLSQDKKWWGIGLGWVILGGWIVALYTGVFLLLSLPVLVPVWFYFRRKDPSLTLDKMRHEGVRGTLKRVEQDLAGPGGEMKPEWAGLAIFLCFPLGLYWLWKHPTLSRDRTWWRIGGAWGLLMFVAAVGVAASNGDKHRQFSATASSSVRSSYDSGSEKRRLLLVEADRLWEAGRHEEAQSKYSEFYRSWPIGVTTLDLDERRAFGPHLAKFYARFIRHCIDTYESQPERYWGELKLAKEQLDYANKNGVPIPADLDHKVRSTRKAIDDAYAARGRKYKAFKAVVAKLKKMPDRFAGMTERENFNKELSKVIAEFDAVPFNVNIQADEGKWIVELYESDVERRYSGQLVNEIDSLVQRIHFELINRR